VYCSRVCRNFFLTWPERVDNLSHHLISLLFKFLPVGYVVHCQYHTLRKSWHGVGWTKSAVFRCGKSGNPRAGQWDVLVSNIAPRSSIRTTEKHHADVTSSQLQQCTMMYRRPTKFNVKLLGENRMSEMWKMYCMDIKTFKSKLHVKKSPVTKYASGT